MTVRLHPLYKQAVVDIVAEYSYGDVIPHEWLRDVCELNPPESGSFEEYQALEFQYLAAVDYIKKALLQDHYMYLENIRGDGYRIVPPPEQGASVWDELTQTLRKCFRKATVGLSCVDFARLSNPERIELTDRQAKLAALRVSSRKQLKAASEVKEA